MRRCDVTGGFSRMVAAASADYVADMLTALWAWRG